MSWSVTASGTPAEVKSQLETSFSYPLAAPPAGLADDGERETVRLIAEMINQCVGTFGTERRLSVSASGHMGFSNWDEKTGGYQEVSISIKPI